MQQEEEEKKLTISEVQYGELYWVEDRELPDNSKYTGFMKKDKYSNNIMEGKGRCEYPDGSSYDGYWENGKEHGNGKYNDIDGFSYDGYWKNGKRHGNGKYKDISGFSYDGHWENDKRHGKGRLEYSDGSSSYDGYWENGKKHGEGVYIEKNNNIHYILNGRYEKDFATKTNSLTVIKDKKKQSWSIKRIEEGNHKDKFLYEKDSSKHIIDPKQVNRFENILNSFGDVDVNEKFGSKFNYDSVRGKLRDSIGFIGTTEHVSYKDRNNIYDNGGLNVNKKERDVLLARGFKIKEVGLIDKPIIDITGRECIIQFKEISVCRHNAMIFEMHDEDRKKGLHEDKLEYTVISDKEDYKQKHEFVNDIVKEIGDKKLTKENILEKMETEKGLKLTRKQMATVKDQKLPKGYEFATEERSAGLFCCGNIKEYYLRKI